MRLAGIFPRAHEEIKGNDGHVHGGQLCGAGRGLGHMVSMHEKGQGNGFDTGWWGVCFSIVAGLALETKINMAESIQARVLGPHAGERLTHLTHSIFHCASPDGSTTGRESAGTVALGKYL